MNLFKTNNLLVYRLLKDLVKRCFPGQIFGQKQYEFEVNKNINYSVKGPSTKDVRKMGRGWF